MEKTYRDIESGKLVTTAQLRKEFAERIVAESEEFDNMTFAEYVRNSLTLHGGTLEEETKKKYIVRCESTQVVAIEVEIEACSESEAMDIFDERNGNGEYRAEWDSAYREEVDAYVDIREKKEG